MGRKKDNIIFFGRSRFFKSRVTPKLLADCHIVGFMQKQFSNFESFIVKASYKEKKQGSQSAGKSPENVSFDMFVCERSEQPLFPMVQRSKSVIKRINRKLTKNAKNTK